MAVEPPDFERPKRFRPAAFCRASAKLYPVSSGFIRRLSAGRAFAGATQIDDVAHS
jgi:hypothetical protein